MYFTKKDFLSLSTDAIIDSLKKEIDGVENNEVLSWETTISILKDNLKSINNECIVILELKLPFSLQRIDVAIAYHTKQTLVFDIIEFKQWDNSNVLGVPSFDRYSIYFNSVDSIRLNPIFQLNSYAYTLLSSYKEFHDGNSKIQQILMMPNYDSTKNNYIVANKNVSFYDKNSYSQYFLNLNLNVEACNYELLLNECKSLTYLTLPSNIFDWIEMEKIKLKNDELIVYKKTLDAFNEGKDIIISGSAGSGKTILGLNIANKLLDSGINVIYASANEIKSTFIKQSDQYSKYNSIFRVFGNAISNIQNNVVIIIDEAHRMQIEQINKIFAQKSYKKFTIIWLIDDAQSYRPLEDVSKNDILQNYNKTDIKDLCLENSQFRCNGDTTYIDSCKKMLNNDNVFINGKVKIVDSLREGIDWYKNLPTDSKGIIASDCWPGGIINIEGFQLTTIKDFGSWMTESSSDHPVSVYKAQGMQKDHILFIWGNEFVYRANSGWIIQKSEVKDRAWIDYFSRNRIDESYVQRKFANLYYVLLTRFQIDMRIYCTDAETREYLKKHFICN